MKEYIKGINKIRSKEYPTVIEVNVPVRFYWTEKEYDGFEFGPLSGCSKYQLKLLQKIIDTFKEQMECTNMIQYLKKHHKDQFGVIIDQIEHDDMISEGIPQTFIDAFEDDK